GYFDLVVSIISNLKINIKSSGFENFLTEAVKSKNADLFAYFIQLFLKNFKIKVVKEMTKKKVVSSSVEIVDNVFNEAVNAGSVDMVREFFKMYKDIEGKTNLEENFLKNRLNKASIVASSKGDVALVNFLVECGADDKKGMFEVALCKSRPEIIRFLLSKYENIKQDFSMLEIAKLLLGYYKGFKKGSSVFEILKLLICKYNELKKGLEMDVLEHVMSKEKVITEDDMHIIEILLEHDWFCKKEHFAFALQSIK
ncbi:unnamed protein product, partial [marine sediment metagenome]